MYWIFDFVRKMMQRRNKQQQQQNLVRWRWWILGCSRLFLSYWLLYAPRRTFIMLKCSGDAVELPFRVHVHVAEARYPTSEDVCIIYLGSGGRAIHVALCDRLPFGTYDGATVLEMFFFSKYTHFTQISVLVCTLSIKWILHKRFRSI